MKRIIILSLFILSSFLSGKAFTLSPNAEISILTCSPGSGLYSLFGHTAIRVQDSSANFDQVFNYGTFDFQTPHFYLKFAQGLLPYQLTHTSFEHFMYAYRYEERSIFSQRLRLDSLQKQQLFNFLLENYRPENRTYLYNFLFDNCTTRSRDILQKSLSTEISWNTIDQHKNFWNLLDEYLYASPWVQWGIHTILGQRGNREATTLQYMFLPDYLMYGLKTATFQQQRLADDVEILYEAPQRELISPWYLTPIFIFSISSLIIITLLWKTQSTWLLNIITLIMFLFSAIVGILIVFLGGFTAHPITAPNWNILWANPLNLLALIFILRRHIPHFISVYLKIYMSILVVAIPAWIICQPAVPVASIAIIILMIYLCLALRSKKKCIDR